MHATEPILTAILQMSSFSSSPCFRMYYMDQAEYMEVYKYIVHEVRLFDIICM